MSMLYGKESSCQCRRHEFDPSVEKTPWRRKWHPLKYSWASLVAQRLKRLPPMWETWVRSLGREDPLQKEMVTHSSILAWRILWTEKLARPQFTGWQRVGHDWLTSLCFFQVFLPGKFHRQRSLVTTVHEVIKNQTLLSDLTTPPS